jgi:alpha-beta hydrolase superfamily lysophospholipase
MAKLIHGLGVSALAIWFGIGDYVRPVLVIAVALVGLGTVYMMERKINRFLTGEGRRLMFPPVIDVHPRPTPTWSLADALTYKNGFVTIKRNDSKIWWQCLRPEKPNAIIVTLHGYADHSDYRMFEFSHDLAVRGNFMVVTLDQPGFGRSDGLWGYIPDWLGHVNACAEAIKKILTAVGDQECKNLPVFCYGHSMGGGLAICSSVLFPRIFQGLVLSAPMCGINPNLRRSWLVEKFFFLLSDWFPRLPITPVPDLSRLCYRDAAFHAQEMKKNRLAFPLKPRLGTAKSLLTAQAWISENAHKVSIPFLIVHGDNDLVTSSHMSLRFRDLAGSKDKDVEIVKGGYHILTGFGMEVEVSDFVFDRIINWINNRLSK